MEDDIYQTQELYQQPNAVMKAASMAVGVNVTCKAIHSYTAKSGDELSFPKDAIITNVIKTDDEAGWWRGDYGGMLKGLLPSNYVEEVLATFWLPPPPSSYFHCSPRSQLCPSISR